MIAEQPTAGPKAHATDNEAFRRAVASVAVAAVIVLATTTTGASPAAGAADPPRPDDIVLEPTNHPQVPGDLARLWLAPEKSSLVARSAALEQFAEAVKLEVDSSFARALPILSRPALQQGTLGPYALYYKGLAELRLNRPADARATFRALAERKPIGYLSEAVALGEADADEALADQAAALIIYERLSGQTTTAPEEILLRLGRAAKAVGNRDEAAAAFSRVYFEFPLSDQALAASTELAAWPTSDALSSSTGRFKLELGRAERLFNAKRYADARPAFERLRSGAQGDDRDLIHVRLAECEYYLKRPRNARDEIRPYLDKGPLRPEALFLHAISSEALGDEAEYLRTVRALADEYPLDRWSEEALNNLATHFIVKNDDAKADAVFRELVDKFPSGRFGERAGWKVGWWAYRNSEYADAVRYFERSAWLFPHSDYRPAWLYWAARAHDALHEPALAQARYSLAATDYLNSYYGRLAVEHLDGRAPERRLVVDLLGGEPMADSGAKSVSLPANQEVVRALLGLKLYDQALDELRYAQKAWGDSPAIQASLAWVYQQQGQSESGPRQFALIRGSITAMRRAYPQFMAAGGESLPKDLLKVIFPISYWDLIKKHAAESHLDPFLVAALVAQESTFVHDITSSAKAVGLMQLLPSTARRYAGKLGSKYSPALLTNPEANIRMGIAYLADQVKQFSGDMHLVLASYNAGERPVRRWMADRPALARDEFIDDIPFPETQGYVKKILGTAEDYRRLYGPEVGPALEVADLAPAAPSTTIADGKPKAAPAAGKKKAPTPARKKSAAATAAARARKAA